MSNLEEVQARTARLLEALPGKTIMNAETTEIHYEEGCMQDLTLKFSDGSSLTLGVTNDEVIFAELNAGVSAPRDSR
jgi:hypothetical protein